MAWPERNLLVRILGGIGAGFLAALLVLVTLSATNFAIAMSPGTLLICLGAGSILGFAGGFAYGDAAIHYIARLLHYGRGAA